MPPLKDDVVALQPAGEVVPRRGDHCVFTLEVLDDLVVGSLFLIQKWVVSGIHEWWQCQKAKTYLLRSIRASALDGLEATLEIVLFLLGFLQLLKERRKIVSKIKVIPQHR